MRFAESIILKELGFSLYSVLHHPHKYILYFIKVLNGSDVLAQYAWNYCNDLMKLDMCVRYDAAVLAGVSIFKAASKCSPPFILPMKEAAAPWYKVLCGVSEVDVILRLSYAMDTHLYNTDTATKVS